MSSMRNAVQRRPHRERAQPKERRRLGLLEKHKDYSLRAKDYNKKKEQLKNLADKAADRNPDEFYFGMMSREGPGQRVKEGKYYTGRVKGDRGNKAMNVDLVRLLKTQDVGYVRTMRQVASKEVRKLEEQVVLTRGLDRLDEEDDEEMMGDDDDEDDDFMFDMPTKAKPARKIVFVDDEDEREELLDQIEDDNEDKEELDDKPPSEEQKQRNEDLRKLRRKLESAKKKLKVLTDAERELEEQRAKMAKTATSGGETSAGKKIKVRTRKR